MFTSFFSRIIGLDPELVKRQPNASRLKILTLGQLLLIPILLWSISGFMIAYNLIETEWYYAAIVGFLTGGMIYIVDRSFVTAYGNEKEKLMRNLRIVFAVLSGIIGAIAIDTTIFAGDILDYQEKKAGTILETEKENYRERYNGELQLAIREKDKAYQNYLDLQSAFLEEMNGDGTGMVGYGPVAKQKEKAAKKAQDLFEEKETELAKLKSKLDTEAKSFAANQAEIGDKTVMQKIHDFHEFVFSDGWNIAFYVIFFLVILLAETMLILYKSGAAKTALDEAIMEEEIASKQRLLSLKRQREKYLNACSELGDEEVEKIYRLSKTA